MQRPSTFPSYNPLFLNLFLLSLSFPSLSVFLHVFYPVYVSLYLLSLFYLSIPRSFCYAHRISLYPTSSCHCPAFFSLPHFTPMFHHPMALFPPFIPLQKYTYTLSPVHFLIPSILYVLLLVPFLLPVSVSLSRFIFL